MVYALLRCHVRNTLKRGAFWRPSGPDTPARFTPRATWSSLELTRVGDHCGPGRHQEFFFGPTKRHCIRPGVAGGRGAATMARGALKTGDIALLHFFTHLPFVAKIACRIHVPHVCTCIMYVCHVCTPHVQYMSCIPVVLLYKVKKSVQLFIQYF